VIDAAPEVSLVLEVAPELDAVVAAGTRVADEVRGVIDRGLEGLLATLGIPGRPAITITRVGEGIEIAPRPFRVLIDGAEAPYPDDILWRVQSFANRTLPDPKASAGRILAWLLDLGRKAEADDTVRGRFATFLGLACLEAVKQSPALLLGEAQASAYLASLAVHIQDRPATWPPDPARIRLILTTVLDQWISLADTRTVAKTLASGLAGELGPEAIAEELIASLRPRIVDSPADTGVIEIRMSAEDLRQFTIDASAGRPPGLAGLREKLYTSTGVWFPALRFVEQAGLLSGTFAVKVNHLLTTPWLVLPRGQVLVRLSPEKTNGQGYQVRGSVLHPSARIALALIQDGEKSAATPPVYDQAGYLALCLEADLEANAARFIHRDLAEAGLRRIGAYAPELEKAARARVGPDRLSRTLRLLAAEGVSLRDLWRVLEAALDCDFVVVDETDEAVFDDRLPVPEPPPTGWSGEAECLAEFVRRRLKAFPSGTFRHDSPRMSVYSIGRDLERELTRHGWAASWLDEPGRARVRQVVRAAIGDPSPTDRLDPIVTSTAARAALRAISSREFPRLPMIAYQELPAGMELSTLRDLAVLAEERAR